MRGQSSQGITFFPITVRCCCTNRTTTKLHVGVVLFVSLWCLMASGHIINLSDLRSVRRVQTLLFTLLPVADAAEADAVHLIAFGVFHLPTNAMQATTTPSAASMPTVSVQLLRKCFAQLSIRTCRHGGGEHVVLAATAVCMCLQRRGSATFSTSSLLRMKKGPNHRYIGRCPI